MFVHQAVILCGGKGTRLGDRVRDLPKPMLPVGGRPVLDHIIENLRAAGVRDFILAAGYLGEVIADYYKTHTPEGCTIETIIEPSPMGTSGSLHFYAEKLAENFIVAYGDVFTDFDASRQINAHKNSGAAATLLVRASDHPWDSDLVVADATGRVEKFLRKREPDQFYRNTANAAFYVLSRRVLDFIAKNSASDFGADVFPAMLKAGETLRTHPLEEEAFVKDMGTPDRLAAVQQYLDDRLLITAARKNPKKITTAFLDRDGVLNAELGLISHPDQLQPLPDASEAVAMLTRAGVRCFIVTNQPVIARGFCDEAMLGKIHAKLLAHIEAAGGKIDGVYFCPHHPETHHNEGVRELRRGCRCRKPSPGMLLQARREHGLDLSACAMIGDRATDIRSGKAAGVRTVLIGSEATRAKERSLAKADAEFASLFAFAQALTTRTVFSE